MKKYNFKIQNQNNENSSIDFFFLKNLHKQSVKITLIRGYLRKYQNLMVAIIIII